MSNLQDLEQRLERIELQVFNYGTDNDKIKFAISILEKLRKHYCHLMWDGRSESDSWVIQECVDLLDKELKQLTRQHEYKGNDDEK